MLMLANEMLPKPDSVLEVERRSDDTVQLLAMRGPIEIQRVTQLSKIRDHYPARMRSASKLAELR